MELSKHRLIMTYLLIVFTFICLRQSQCRSIWKKRPSLLGDGVLSQGHQPRVVRVTGYHSKVVKKTEEDINHDIGIDKELFEGDIVMDKTNHSLKNSFTLGRSAVPDKTKHWNPSAIPYELNTAIHNPAAVYAIKSAISEIERLTCLRFVERKNEPDYIYFFPGNGCWSHVGKSGGRQMMSVGPGCELTGIVLHELLHTLGFYHEHSRTDRDDYVKIEWQNMNDDAKNNFDKYSHGEIDHLGEPYDYGSITHYGPRFFSKDGKLPTISKLQPGGPKMGQRRQLSPTDANQVNKLYHCTEYIRNPKPTPSSGPLSVVAFGKCMFDDDMCLWENSANDQFDWTRRSGATPSRSTGPSADHTTGSGYYIYIESSYPREKDDAAVLTSGYYYGPFCFTFAFNMHGASTGDLRVWGKSENGSYSKLWEKSGDHGSAWHSAAVDFTPDNLFKVFIEGVVGKSWQGDIALDDLETRPGAC